MNALGAACCGEAGSRVEDGRAEVVRDMLRGERNWGDYWLGRLWVFKVVKQGERGGGEDEKKVKKEKLRDCFNGLLIYNFGFDSFLLSFS